MGSCIAVHIIEHDCLSCLLFDDDDVVLVVPVLDLSCLNFIDAKLFMLLFMASNGGFSQKKNVSKF